VEEQPKLRKGFEELLPPDWADAAAPAAAASETPPQQQAVEGPATPVRLAVAEHSWAGGEDGDLSLTEGERALCQLALI
jgi:hypothetical protein